MTLTAAHESPRRGLLAIAGAICILAFGACAPKSVQRAEYVGRVACASCHVAEDSLWQGSHHAVAMEVADTTTVLGDFNDASYTYNGVTSRFFRRDGRFWGFLPIDQVKGRALVVYWSYEATREEYHRTGLVEWVKDTLSAFGRTRWKRFFHVIR